MYRPVNKWLSEWVREWVEFNAPPDTIQVISEAEFTDQVVCNKWMDRKLKKKMRTTSTLHEEWSGRSDGTFLKNFDDAGVLHVAHNSAVDLDEQVALLQTSAARTIEQLLHSLSMDAVGDRKSKAVRAADDVDRQQMRRMLEHRRRSVAVSALVWTWTFHSKTYAINQSVDEERKTV